MKVKKYCYLLLLVVLLSSCSKIASSVEFSEKKDPLVTINKKGEIIIEQFETANNELPYTVSLNNKVIGYNFSTNKKKISFLMVLPPEEGQLTHKIAGTLDLRSGEVTPNIILHILISVVVISGTWLFYKKLALKLKVVNGKIMSIRLA